MLIVNSEGGGEAAKPVSGPELAAGMGKWVGACKYERNLLKGGVISVGCVS